MDGLRDYILDENPHCLKAVISRLADDLRLMIDAVKLRQLSSALLLFQDAVNSSLRLHSVKPHWMFALDDLVR